jgi:hypothetical protein
MRPYLETKPLHKRVSRVAQGVGPEFKPQYHKKKKKKPPHYDFFLPHLEWPYSRAIIKDGKDPVK